MYQFSVAIFLLIVIEIEKYDFSYNIQLLVFYTEFPVVIITTEIMWYLLPKNILA